jgi:hypothetical protein
MGVNDTAEHDVCVAVGYDLCDLAFEMRFGLGDANGRTVAEDAGCQMTGGPRVRIRLPPAASQVRTSQKTEPRTFQMFNHTQQTAPRPLNRR